MVIKKSQFAYNDTINQINNANNDQLNLFIKQYLGNHSYFKAKDISLKYLYQEHQLTFYNLSSYNHIIDNLARKIGKLLGPYKLNGNIALYNAKTYQVIK